MIRIERISKKYLENNIFLITGCLMTSWFDFVCYAVGLTKLPWKKFMPALILSIVISDTPFVATGYTLSKLNGMQFKQIINGDIPLIEGPYLILFISSVITIFGLGFLNLYLQKKSNLEDL